MALSQAGEASRNGRSDHYDSIARWYIARRQKAPRIVFKIYVLSYNDLEHMITALHGF